MHRSPPPLTPPGPNASVFLLCARLMPPGKANLLASATVETTQWPTLDEAIEAAEIQPCSRLCIKDHVVVFADRDGRPRVQRITAPNLRTTQQPGERR